MESVLITVVAIWSRVLKIRHLTQARTLRHFEPSADQGVYQSKPFLDV